jgi:sugar O-acyltransferase (sialic acid O-acetyltransferase NeuD family)
VDRRLLILGAGGHARAVADLAAECGFTVVGFTERATRTAPGVVATDADVAELHRMGRIDAGIVGVGTAALARRAELHALLRSLGIPVPVLVHPRAAVSRSCAIGEGSVVFAGAVLGTDVEVGENAVLYSAVVVEHGSRIGAHAYLSPGVILAGAVTVEPGAFLGAGAVVVPGVTVGKDAVVGAGAVVLADVSAASTVVGLPARPTGPR